MESDFEHFVRSVQGELTHFGLLLAGNPHDADDLVQSSLEKVGIRWARVRNLAQPLAYTKKTMVNMHVSRWRRVRREWLTAHDHESVAAATQILDEQPLWVALGELPPRQRAVLVLRYYLDLSESEIAEVLGCRPGTVKSQASRALIKLRAQLENDDFANSQGARHDLHS